MPLKLNEVHARPLLSLFRAMQYKHRVIFWSSFTAILTYFFQPLSKLAPNVTFRYPN